MRTHFDYGDIIYHNHRMEMIKVAEQIQYKVGLLVTGTTEDNDDLGWESLSDRRYRRLFIWFKKIRNHEASQYLHDHL